MIFKDESMVREYQEEKEKNRQGKDMRSLVNGEGVPENILNVEDMDD